CLASCASQGHETRLDAARWVDLTHSFDEETIYWPNNPFGFELAVQFQGRTPGGWYYSSNSLRAPEHGGTHLDAPVHFHEGGHATDQIPLEQLVGVGCVVDVSGRVGEDADYLVSIADVQAWEQRHGRIPEGAIILLRTGWDRYYDDRVKCLGTPKKGTEAIPELHFPGIDPRLAQWLAAERRPKAVGLDTPSVDFGQSTDFQTHRIFAAHGICGFENVANLEQLPARGAFIVALPMKIAGGTGGPLRIVAVL
ncbi:MAG: cyclase family protein, partial [Planctomycetia bacterium]